MRRAFTLVELLSVIAIVAVLSVAAVFFTMSYTQWAQSVSDQRTLLVLNDALNRYKCEGGNVTSLTNGSPIKHVMANLQSPINWAGNVHQVMQSGMTYPARSIFAAGSGASYRFTAFNTYANEAGGTSPTGLIRIYLTSTAALPTWTVPNDWNSSNNKIECIGGGGGGGGSGSGKNGGGGGAYAQIVNFSLTPGASVSYQVGAVNSDTWFNGANFAASSCGAKGGSMGAYHGGGIGGTAAASIGTLKYSGGNSGQSGVGGQDNGCGGGGGAAGPLGNGRNGGDNNGLAHGGGGGNGGGSVGSNGTSNGGAGGNNATGNGGGIGAIDGISSATAGTNGGGGGGAYYTVLPYAYGSGGGNGTEWDASHGSGGGGGGGASGSSNTGGLYGGGGGGRSGAAGAQGIIVISYTH